MILSLRNVAKVIRTFSSVNKAPPCTLEIKGCLHFTRVNLRVSIKEWPILLLCTLSPRGTTVSICSIEYISDDVTTCRCSPNKPLLGPFFMGAGCVGSQSEV